MALPMRSATMITCCYFYEDSSASCCLETRTYGCFHLKPSKPILSWRCFRAKCRANSNWRLQRRYLDQIGWVAKESFHHTFDHSFGTTWLVKVWEHSFTASATLVGSRQRIATSVGGVTFGAFNQLGLGWGPSNCPCCHWSLQRPSSSSEGLHLLIRSNFQAAGQTFVSEEQLTALQLSLEASCTVHSYPFAAFTAGFAFELVLMLALRPTTTPTLISVLKWELVLVPKLVDFTAASYTDATKSKATKYSCPFESSSWAMLAVGPSWIYFLRAKRVRRRKSHSTSLSLCADAFGSAYTSCTRASSVCSDTDISFSSSQLTAGSWQRMGCYCLCYLYPFGGIAFS